MDFWSGRKVLVTGAGGFIGSHLCEKLLTAGASVTAMVHYDSRPDPSNLTFLDAAVRRRLEIVSGDICDPFFVRGAVVGKDTVFHLAALIGIPYSYVAPQTYVRTNIEGTLNVAEACRREGCRRLVHTSTSETYGTAEFTPMTELHPLKGQSPYSASKIGADKMVESYFLSFDLPVVTLRPFKTYGPRQSARAVIPSIIYQCLSRQPALLLGDLKPVRDFNYVGDTASAFMAVAQHDECLGKTLNTGTGEGVSIAAVAELIMGITGVTLPFRSDEKRFRPEASEVHRLIADSSRLRQLTGWAPAFTLRQGLEESARFFGKHLDRFGDVSYAV